MAEGSNSVPIPSTDEAEVIAESKDEIDFGGNGISLLSFASQLVEPSEPSETQRICLRSTFRQKLVESIIYGSMW